MGSTRAAPRPTGAHGRAFGHGGRAYFFSIREGVNELTSNGATGGILPPMLRSNLCLAWHVTALLRLSVAGTEPARRSVALIASDDLQGPGMPAGLAYPRMASRHLVASSIAYNDTKGVQQNGTCMHKCLHAERPCTNARRRAVSRPDASKHVDTASVTITQLNAKIIAMQLDAWN